MTYSLDVAAAPTVPPTAPTAPAPTTGSAGSGPGEVSQLRPRARVLVARPGAVPVVVTCAGATCAGTASVSVARRVERGGKQVGWRHLLLGEARFRIPSNRTVTILLAETKLGRRVLAAELPYWFGRETRYHLTLTVTAPGSRTTHTPTYLRRR